MYGKQVEMYNPNSCNDSAANASRCGFGVSDINDMRSSREILIKQIGERAFKSYTFLAENSGFLSALVFM